MLHQHRTLNACGKLLDLSSPLVMGILNATPDSFFDGGKYVGVDAAVSQAMHMIEEGADIIDIGGMSSRPGADLVEPDEEQGRVIPVIREILSAKPDTVISIDTIHSSTADAALNAGARIVNDISGGRFDEKIIDVTSAARAPFVCMHMQGMPKTMQNEPSYGDVVHEVLQYFVERLRVLRTAGISDVIIDPGFGFGKSVKHNYQILNKLNVFAILEMPVLAGISRKSMICKVLKINPVDALNGTTALHMVALQNGAKILRVHDVKEAREVIALYEFSKHATGSDPGI